MKVIPHWIISISMIGIVVACTNNLDSLENSLDLNGEFVEEPTSPHHIPLSEALSRLESTMQVMGIDDTRVAKRANWSVTRIPISTFEPQTRSGNADAADALYVVDFEGGGYAILSADDRLPDDVIAVTSSGNVEFDPSPLDTADITLNDLYVEEDDDYLLGAVQSDGMVEALVTNYVIGWIDSLRGNEDEFGDPILPPIGGGDDGDDEGGGSANDLVVEYTYETEVLHDRKLQTTWHQRDPYNRYCPNRYFHYNILGLKVGSVEEYDFDPRAEWDENYIDSVDLAAGCIAIAVGQILAYNQYPTIGFIINESNAMPWDSLLMQNVNDVIRTRQEDYLAKLIHACGVGCDMRYGFMKTEQSFATPNAAKRYLQSIGYTNVVRHCGYSSDTIKLQLEKDCPIMIGALGPVSESKKRGHAWVIDGYKIVRKIKTIMRPITGVILSQETESTTDYVHCNWGWGGTSDGWFSSTLLDTDTYIDPSDAESFDDPNTTPQSGAYTWWFRMVTYDKPNAN